MRRALPRWAARAGFAALLLVAACAPLSKAGVDARPVDGGVAPAAAATANAPSGESPPFGPPLEPDAARMLEHIRVLAAEIGVRETGTPGEQRAAEYIRGELERAGYRVTLEPFVVDVPRDRSMILAVPPGASELEALAMTGAPDGEVRGRLLFAGLGRASDYAGVDARGAIVLVNRGVTTFREKAEIAQQAGAAGVVVANNQSGLFRGTIDRSGVAITIPIVTTSPDSAALLDAAAVQGAVIAIRADRTSEPFESRNVIARPSEELCTALVGAHYDSVPRAPGANDNASGTAGMLEIARTHRAPGLCFAAFGAEEVGLVGSEAYIKAHGVAGLRFMLNLDVLGVLGGPEVVAVTDNPRSRAMAERAARVAGDAGFAIPQGAFPPFASSDHAPFVDAGVPAVTLTSGDDRQIHTPGDDFAHIAPESVATMLKAGTVILRDLLSAQR